MSEWCFTPQFSTVRLYQARETWANAMSFGMNHAPGAGSITRPIDTLQYTLHTTTVPKLLQDCLEDTVMNIQNFFFLYFHSIS